MQAIWLSSYPKAIPHTVKTDTFSSLVDLFDKTVARYAKSIAFENFGCRLTYAEIQQKANAFCAFLQTQYKVKKGERIALMLPNSLQYPVCLFGALKAGLVIVNVNPLYTATEFKHQVNDANAKYCVIFNTAIETISAVMAETTIEKWIISDLTDLFSYPKKILFKFAMRYLKGIKPSKKLPENSVYLRKILQTSNPYSFKSVPLNPEDLAFLQYTGGTTGVAKGAMLSHHNLLANLAQVLAWLQPILETKTKTKTKIQEVIITALPLYHIFSLTANCLLFFCVGGKNILITDPRDIKTFLHILKKTPYFTAFTGVNTLFKALLAQAAFKKLNFSQLKLALGGGMPVQSSVAKDWEKTVGHPLLEAYGLTETSPAVCITPLTEKHYTGNIGLPIPSTEISIRDEQDQECAIDVVGELCVKGPQVTAGYWNKPEETAQSFTSDQFFRTGDLASINQAGYIRLHGRKKEMIIVSGFNVYPQEIENIIAAHPAVLEVAIIGVESPKTGEAIHAFIVKRNPSLDSATIIQYCKQYLTAYKIPKKITFLPSLPKSAVGKILKTALKSN